MYPKTIGNVPAPETRPLARPPKGAPPEGNAKEVTRRRRRVPTAALRDDSVVAHGSFAARQCRSTGCRVCRVNVHTQSAQTELGPENCPTAKRGCGKYGRTRALFTRWPLISEASLPVFQRGRGRISTIWPNMKFRAHSLDRALLRECLSACFSWPSPPPFRVLGRYPDEEFSPPEQPLARPLWLAHAQHLLSASSKRSVSWSARSRRRSRC